ncbi:nuclear pore complex subunit Nup192 [Aulographum hederae CBS 113979]|uniref:Nuclear pore complex subunit Nup192 n=1 Tax=Aulographum hederae CBS 113979 TaxID=1176131 RepID=A0A6G1HAF5_9PEZI|nr:nuclear pore complex subunit Nup192 [Aulographum hederae CBS 113979]
MAETSLAALAGLHQDLSDLLQSKLQNVDRLWDELRQHVEEFKKLLDKPARNNTSRNTISSGSIEIDGTTWSLNKDFQERILEIADQLDLDELEAAKIAIFVHQSPDGDIDRDLRFGAILHFHKRRVLVLECLRIILQLSLDEDADDVTSGSSREFVRLVVAAEPRALNDGSRYWQRCFRGLDNIQSWLNTLGEHLNRAATLDMETVECLQHQQTSLTSQHESLAAICALLVKEDYTTVDDFRLLLTKVASIDRYITILIHYVPILMCSITKFGHIEGGSSDEEAASIHEFFTQAKERSPWGLRSFYAASLIWWLAEYSSRASEHARGSASRVALDDLSKLFVEALKDGSFHFMLTVCNDITNNEWCDPAKDQFVSMLLNDSATVLPPDSQPLDGCVSDLIMVQLQNFVDVFITNMPNSLRLLKKEEDTKRKEWFAHPQAQGTLPENVHDLERFLLVVSFAFESSPEAAGDFWSDREGNLFGFLQWAARRQTTPRVAAFCELLLSISRNEECADSAHSFLLEEGTLTTGKLRRTSSLSWAQVANELHFYATSVMESMAKGQTIAHHPSPQEVVEPESAMMLEYYLRLIAHLSLISPKAREWVISSTSLQLQPMLFQLCLPTVDARLKACAWTALESTLIGKSPELGNDTWIHLDEWLYVSASFAGNSRIAMGPSMKEQVKANLDAIASSPQERISFVSLLNSLMAPPDLDAGLNDRLPFPESLGQNYRKSGPEDYVDFAVSRIFGSISVFQQTAFQDRQLRLKCLAFIATCLSSFNEDLVVLANRSNVEVEKAIEPSSLLAYVRLHPFARVMDCLFSEKVLNSLFSTVVQNVDEVNRALPSSPLVMSIVAAIDVIMLVLDLQPTYLDIVRPIAKAVWADRGGPLSNPALASFEDAVTNHLGIVVNLGLYCGTSHQNLVVRSLSLLERLSTSKKLTIAPSSGFGQRSDRSKLVGILEKNQDAERIAKSLADQTNFDAREIMLGPDAPGYIIKCGILDFLKNCLSAFPDRPTVAHLMLGFSCQGNRLVIPQDGAFAVAKSLFHGVLRLASDYPEIDGSSYSSIYSSIKAKSVEILRLLWQSPLSSQLVMAELRYNDFMLWWSTKLIVVDADTLWDQQTIYEPEFLHFQAADGFRNFLQQRSSFFDYAHRELLATVTGRMPSLRSRIQSSLLGTTSIPGIEPIQNATIFELFDFEELVPRMLEELPLQHFQDIDLSICKNEDSEATVFNLKLVRELLLLKKKYLLKAGGPSLSAEKFESIQYESEFIEALCQASNQQASLTLAQRDTMKGWTRLMATVVEVCELEGELKSSFILQALEVILPKLEQAFSRSSETAVELASLARTLLHHTDYDESSSEQNRLGEYTSDRLFQLFRTALGGIFCREATAELREICYHICFRYLYEVNKRSKDTALSKNAMKTVKAAGDRLIDSLCDDSYSGKGTSRVSALLLLDALVCLGNREQPKYMLQSLGRHNFVGALVDTVKTISSELGVLDDQERSTVLSFYNSLLAVLLRLSQTRLGATHIVNAGIFQSIHDSEIFSVDPDVGFDFANPQALTRYFALVLSVLRVITSVVISKGPQNEQTMGLARQFLSEHRMSMVGIFKRNAGITSGGGGGRRRGEMSDLSDLVDQYTLLISATGFLEFEEESFDRRQASGMFS